MRETRPSGGNVEFVVATNLSELSAETLALCADHQIHLSTSLDGPAWLHDAIGLVRGGDSHERVIRNLGVVRAALGHDRVSALMTTTTRSRTFPRRSWTNTSRRGSTTVPSADQSLRLRRACSRSLV